MKSSKLLLISITIIIILAGTAHLFAMMSGNPNSSDSNDNSPDIIQTEITGTINDSQELIKNTPLDKLAGNWKVDYKTNEFTGSIINSLKIEGDIVKGFTIKYVDQYGDELKENKLVVLIKSFDGVKGKGIYKLDYEGKNYDIPCTIKMNSDRQFQLVYSYYDYKGSETWNKIIQ